MMNRRSPLRSMSSALLCALVALSVTGLPLSHEADHDGDIAHVEHSHGGHGTVLIDQDERLLSKTFSFAALAVHLTLPVSEPAASSESFELVPFFAHPGRDPPAESRPRAPPTLLS